MDNNAQNQLIENYKVICLCRSIKKGTILKAIKDGCKSVEDINRKLGAGGGDCNGERCQEKIGEIVKGSK